MKTYTELSSLKTFEERFDYLKTKSSIGVETFGNDRYLNQVLYKSKEWRELRNRIILRDNGCDLGVPGYELQSGQITVHHMNPITVEDVLNRNPDIFNPEYLISVSHSTHKALHYGDLGTAPKGPIIRKPNDTCPWKENNER